MSDFDEGYRRMLFEREFPRPVPAQEPAPKAATKPKETGAGTATMDVLAGLLKGSVAATLGLPGDLESLVRLLTGGEQKLPTTEDVQAKLPAVVNPPAGDPGDPEYLKRNNRVTAAEAAGEFIPLAPVAMARKAISRAVTNSPDVLAGVASGGRKAQRGAIGPQTGFENVPNTLMGFATKNKPGKAFAESKYKAVVYVEVTDEKGNKFYDAIRGMNEKHATERAKRNWDDGMTVKLISEDDAKKVDPELVREVNAVMPAGDRVIRYDASGSRMESAQ